MLQYHGALLACLEAKYIELPFIKNWADNIIEKANSPQLWLVELSMCKNTTEAIIIIKEYLESKKYDYYKRYSRLYFGFLFLAFYENKVDYNIFITNLVSRSDNCDLNEISIDALFVDDSSNSIKSIDPEIINYLEKLSTICKIIFNYISNDMFYDFEKDTIDRSTIQ